MRAGTGLRLVGHSFGVSGSQWVLCRGGEAIDLRDGLLHGSCENTACKNTHNIRPPCLWNARVNASDHARTDAHRVRILQASMRASRNMIAGRSGLAVSRRGAIDRLPLALVLLANVGIRVTASRQPHWLCQSRASHSVSCTEPRSIALNSKPVLCSPQSTGILVRTVHARRREQGISACKSSPQ